MLVFKIALFLLSVVTSLQQATDELRSITLDNENQPESYDFDCTDSDEHCSIKSSEGLLSNTISSCNNATRQGQHRLQLNNQTRPFPVFCVVGHRVGGTGGWILVQQRIDGLEDFVRSWVDYRDGFGDMKREYWLGLEHLHQITNSGHYELVVDVAYIDGVAQWARYTHFAIAGEDDKYRLRDLGTFTGNAGTGDGLRAHVGERFSTFDSENDVSDVFHCSVRHTGGWWFSDSCISGSNLNGIHQVHNMHTSVLWNAPAGHVARIFSRMLIRRVPNSDSSIV